MSIQTINGWRLKTEVKSLKDICFWASSHYWTTRHPKEKQKAKVRIKIAYLKSSGWFAFVFNKFHLVAVGIFRDLEGGVWFYTEPINQFTSFSVWCVNAKHFSAVLERLLELDDVEVEFVVAATKKGLCLPAPFAAMNQEFFEVGHPC